MFCFQEGFCFHFVGAKITASLQGVKGKLTRDRRAYWRVYRSGPQFSVFSRSGMLS